MADGVSYVSQQSLSEIFGKIDKAAEQGREVFVNDQGDVRTKRQFKSFFIRHFQPGFQAQQSEKLPRRLPTPPTAAEKMRARYLIAKWQRLKRVRCRVFMRAP